MGVKKADSVDATVATLNETTFSSWAAFGFDWLIGFENSSTLVNRTSPGSGDETARAGVSVVSDPPGWVWAASIAPVADFTGTPTSGTASLSVAFTDTSTNTPTSWAWTFGDGGTSTSQNPTHSYTSSGVYTVTLVATNASGSDTKTRTAYITVGETISYAAGGGIEIWR
jgi:PKD repeat protein